MTYIRILMDTNLGEKITSDCLVALQLNHKHPTLHIFY